MKLYRIYSPRLAMAANVFQIRTQSRYLDISFPNYVFPHFACGRNGANTRIMLLDFPLTIYFYPSFLYNFISNEVNLYVWVCSNVFCSVCPQTFRHGFPFSPTALAWDPIQKLLAIGDKGGNLRMYPFHYNTLPYTSLYYIIAVSETHKYGEKT